jgi:hypothetical protein
MKVLDFSVRKNLFLSLLGLTFVLGACSSQATAPTSVPNTNLNNSGSGVNAGATQSTSSNGSTAFTYENVDIVIDSMDQQNKFTDDTSTSGAFVLRLATKESNKTDSSVYIPYGDVFHLISPDGNSIPASEEKTADTIGQGVIRNNWVDFPLESKQNIDKLILHIGKADEHQMDIPLTKNPDLSQYQPKTITPNSKLQYGGVDWTVTKVTASLNAEGKQADVGKRYIAVELLVNNSGADSFYVDPSSYIRLKSQDVSQAPTSSTLQLPISAGSKGATGVVYFLMPESDTQLTLDFLAQSDSHIKEASTSFQIPA